MGGNMSSKLLFVIERTETMLAETVLAKIVVCSWLCNTCSCTNVAVKPVRVRIHTITRECSRKLRPLPNMRKTRACANIPHISRALKSNLPTWLLPTWFTWP